MALNIDTIRSLDANKTYYLANSTGEIKEAGAWQKFKCFFGIGDARQKVQKLIDQVKIALLKEVGESDNAKLTADIKSYDDDRYIDLSASRTASPRPTRKSSPRRRPRRSAPSTSSRS